MTDYDEQEKVKSRTYREIPSERDGKRGKFFVFGLLLLL